MKITESNDYKGLDNIINNYSDNFDCDKADVIANFEKNVDTSKTIWCKKTRFNEIL